MQKVREKARVAWDRIRWATGRIVWEAGQTTAEYALVLLAAAAVAVVLINWAAGGDRLRNLFDTVLDNVTSRASQQ